MSNKFSQIPNSNKLSVLLTMTLACKNCYRKI